MIKNIQNGALLIINFLNYGKYVSSCANYNWMRALLILFWSKLRTSPACSLAAGLHIYDKFFTGCWAFQFFLNSAGILEYTQHLYWEIELICNLSSTQRKSDDQYELNSVRLMSERKYICLKLYFKVKLWYRKEFGVGWNWDCTNYSLEKHGWVTVGLWLLFTLKWAERNLVFT